MKYCTIGVTLFALAAAMVPAARADIVFGTANRVVQINTNQGGASISTTAASGFFSGGASTAAGSASQTSDIQPLQITGTGAASLDQFEDSTALSRSLMSVAFSLTTPHTFSLTGNTNVDFEVGDPVASFKLTGPATNLLFAGNSIFTQSGLLGPGNYQLDALASISANSNGNAEANANFTFRLDLAPAAVPEPASFLMFGLAMSAAVAGLSSRTRPRVANA